MPGCFLMAGIFLSTPSARRATYAGTQTGVDSWISIHALREEGDVQNTTRDIIDNQFLSTPSARRATHAVEVGRGAIQFLSTPSARRATLPPSTGYHSRA